MQNKSHVRNYKIRYWQNRAKLIQAKWIINAFFGTEHPPSFWNQWWQLVTSEPEVRQSKRSARKIWCKYIQNQEWQKNFVREEDLVCIALALKEFQKKLHRAAQPVRILNVGLAKGMSHLGFHGLIPDANIDTIEIDPDLVDDFQNRIRLLFPESHANHRIHIGSSVGLNPKSHALNKKLHQRFPNTDEHLHLIQKLLTRHTYDLIFLDGDHARTHVLAELNAIWENRCSVPGTCLVALHDVGREPGKALDEFAAARNLRTLKIHLQPHPPRVGFVVV